MNWKTVGILSESSALQFETVAAAGMATSVMVGVHQSHDQARSAHTMSKEKGSKQCALKQTY